MIKILKKGSGRYYGKLDEFDFEVLFKSYNSREIIKITISKVMEDKFGGDPFKPSRSKRVATFYKEVNGKIEIGRFTKEFEELQNYIIRIHFMRYQLY